MRLLSPNISSVLEAIIIWVHNSSTEFNKEKRYSLERGCKCEKNECEIQAAVAAKILLFSLAVKYKTNGFLAGFRALVQSYFGYFYAVHWTLNTQNLIFTIVVMHCKERSTWALHLVLP